MFDICVVCSRTKAKVGNKSVPYFGILVNKDTRHIKGGRFRGGGWLTVACVCFLLTQIKSGTGKPIRYSYLKFQRP
jgi:hypothetical protein